jgi:flagellar protein FlgJ
MSMSIDGMAAMLNTTNTDATTNYNANALKKSLNQVSSDTSEDELMQVCKDFESYFVEEIIKEVKKNLLPEDDDKDASLSTMTDYTMDFAVEKVADEIIDQVGENFTQSLYEQMKRNYNID